MLVLAVLSAAIAVAATGLVRAAIYRSGAEGLMVTNFRGARVPAIGGVLIVCAFILSEAILAMLSTLRPVALDGNEAFSPGAIGWTFMSSDHVVVLIVVFGFFLLGAIDDIAGAGQAKGISGHLKAIRRGEVTSGAIKAIGGIAIAFVCGSLFEREMVPAVVDALLIASTANLVNLFDLRPGRAIKVFFLMWLPTAIAGYKAPFLPLSSVVAASAAAWLPTDLKEKGMLGDSGANLLGGVAGVGFAIVLDVPVKLAVLALVVGLTLVSEKHSFSSLIEKWSILRKFDALGRVRE